VKILFVADVFGAPGRGAVAALVHRLRVEGEADVVVANGENLASGRGITKKLADELFASDVDVITTGNHVWDRKEVLREIERLPRVLRPANFPPGVPGSGTAIFTTRDRLRLGVANLQGRTFMHDIDCPFRAADRIMEQFEGHTDAVLVDFHAEATSEKIAMGWYLDGRAGAVVGTHTHVQTADERVLPGGTAYITDAGMTGPHDSVIGAVKEGAIRRFLTPIPERLSPAVGDIKLCGVWIDIDENTGAAREIVRVRRDWDPDVPETEAL
jgi:metallophosphoesterase (TIGR00282 family)